MFGNHWFDRYTISRSNLYSLCEVVCGCKAMQSEQNKQIICKGSHRSRTSNRNSISMQAEWEHAYLWLSVNLVQCRLKESVFHLMLQNNAAPYIGRNCRISVAYNFGCRALYILPCRVSVGVHQVKCDIPTSRLLWKNIYHFLERCRISNNVCLCVLVQSDCSYSSLFFEHCNRIWICDWVHGCCSVCLLEGVCRP